MRYAVTTGMTHSEVFDRVGPPTFRDRDDVWWYDGPDHSVGVRFAKCTVRQLDIDRDRAWVADMSREHDLFL